MREAYLLAGDLAARLGGTLVGDGSVALRCIGVGVSPGELCVVHEGRAPGDAVAVLGTGAPNGGPATIVVDHVPRAAARASDWLPVRRRAHYLRERPRRIDDTATIAADALIGAGVTVGAHAVVERGAVLDAGTSVGDYSRIGAYSVLRNGCQIGNRVHIGDGCTLGNDGFCFVRDGVAWLRVPSFGSVRIDDDVSMQDQIVVHAGVFGQTTIGRGCILDSQVLIGHDAVVGAYSALAGQSAVAGAARIGRGCRIAGRVAIGEGVAIADDVTITATSMVTRSITQAGARYSSGWPAQASAHWWRMVAAVRRLSREHGHAVDTDKE